MEEGLDPMGLDPMGLDPMGLDLFDLLTQQFQLEDVDIRTYSSLALAYIGDGIYELVIRTILIKQGNCPVNSLHKRASALVRAGAQSEMMRALEPLLTQEELKVYRRGRNAHPATMARHATVTEYRRATGFEALMGWLYLMGRWERMIELMKIGVEHVYHPQVR